MSMMIFSVGSGTTPKFCGMGLCRRLLPVLVSTMREFNLDGSPQVLQRWAGQYGTAILTTGIAIWVRASLQPWLGNQCEFSLFYLSVLAKLWIAGTRPAIFAIVLGSIAAAHFFIEPESSIYIQDVPDLVQWLIFVIVNVTATLLFSRLVRQRRLAENRSDENRRLSESLRIADERKDEFLALLAHELRNPLAPIRSSLALLERSPNSTETVLRLRDVIGRQTNHLVRITDDLLDVSRFCRGKVTLKIEQLVKPIGFPELIQHVEHQMSMAGMSSHEDRCLANASLLEDETRACGTVHNCDETLVSITSGLETKNCLT